MKIVKVDNNEKDISFVIKIEKEIWKKMQEKQFKKLAKNIKIPGGFRPGHPAHTLKAKSAISENEIIESSVNNEINNINKWLINEKEFLNLEEDILNEQPELVIEKVDKESLDLIFKFKKIPTVKIGDYKKIKIEIKNEITKDEIKIEIQKILNNNSELISKKNEIISKGNFVIFDFEGFINGEKMKNGSSNNFELEIGSNQFIPGFEEKMIGLKLNEEKEIKLNFPKDYHAKEVAGKEAIFKIKINGIKEKKMPLLNDEFIKSLKIKDINNEKEFNDYIKNKIKKEKEVQNTNDLRTNLFKEISKITTLSHDDNFSIEQEKKAIENEYNKMISKSGMKLDDFIKLTGQSKETFFNTIDTQSRENVKVKYAIIEISEKEKIKLLDSEMNSYLEEIANQEKIKLEELKDKISDNIELIKERLIFNKTIDFLIEEVKKNNK